MVASQAFRAFLCFVLFFVIVISFDYSEVSQTSKRVLLIAYWNIPLLILQQNHPLNCLGRLLKDRQSYRCLSRDLVYLCAHRLTPMLRLLRLPPCSLEGNFVAFTSSKVNVSWCLYAMLIDANGRFAVGYEFCLLRWIMCSLVHLIQCSIWVASTVAKCFFS